jgi:hypothetical protein
VLKKKGFTTCADDFHFFGVFNVLFHIHKQFHMCVSCLFLYTMSFFASLGSEFCFQGDYKTYLYDMQFWMSFSCSFLYTMKFLNLIYLIWRSDISNRARVLLSRWSKSLARSQAMKKPNGMKTSSDSQELALLKRRQGHLLLPWH